jgi:predicted DNA-binding transcriptional regulator AlpA
VATGTEGGSGAARDIAEAYRKSELRLRLLLLGDADTPPLVKGDMPRQRVTSEIKHLRAAFDQLLEAERRSRAEIAEAAKALNSELAERASSRAEAQRASEASPLMRPAEAAKLLGMSTASLYRAINRGEIRRATPEGTPIKVASTEILRLLAARSTSGENTP